MRTRTEAARYAERLLNGPSCGSESIELVSRKGANHFGKVELRTLFDYIWEGEPREHDEKIDPRHLRNNTATKNKRFDND